MVKHIIILGLSVRVLSAFEPLDQAIQGNQAPRRESSPAASSSAEEQVKLLHAALRRGAKAEVENILRRVTIADVRKVELPNGENIMHLAARNENRTIFDLLRSKQEYAPMMDEKNNNGETPREVLYPRGDFSPTFAADQPSDVRTTSTSHAIGLALFIGREEKERIVGSFRAAIDKDDTADLQVILSECDLKKIDSRNLCDFSPLHYAISQEKVNTFCILFSKYPDQFDDVAAWLLGLDSTKKSYEFSLAVSAVAAAPNSTRTSEEVSALSRAAQKVFPIQLKTELQRAIEKDDKESVSEALRACKRNNLEIAPIRFGARKMTVLHVAVLTKALKAFSVLLTDHSNLLIEKDADGYTVFDLIHFNSTKDELLPIVEEHKQRRAPGGDASALSPAAVAAPSVPILRPQLFFR